MSFAVSPDPASFTLAAGGAQEVVFTFSGVPAEVSGAAIIPFQLGAENVTVALGVTLDEPDPVVGTITLPAGVFFEVLSIDDVSATIRFSR